MTDANRTPRLGEHAAAQERTCVKIKKPRVTSCGKNTFFVKVFGALLYSLFVWNVWSVNATNKPDDQVTIFKQALSSPPDVEQYIVRQRNFQGPPRAAYHRSSDATNDYISPFQYFEGARSGTNYFLHMLPNPSAKPDSNHLGIIAGRSLSSNYEIGGNVVSYGLGSNGLTANVNVLFYLTRQFLDMGASEIEPETVKWNGNEFVAKSNRGKTLYGSLEVSNNLPTCLAISYSNNTTPYKLIAYTYPKQLDSLGGYPAKLLITTRKNDGYKPSVELQFISVLLATHHLSSTFFSGVEFAERVKYTNIFSNSVLYVYDTKSKGLVKAPDSLLKSGAYTNSNNRTVIYLCFVCLTIFPIAFLSIWSFRKNKIK